MKPIKLNATGSVIADYLYTNISFAEAGFSRFRSKEPGDGGLEPGKLVLTEDFEAFCKRSTDEVLAEIVGDRKPDAFNLGGPGVVALINTAQLLAEMPITSSFYSTNGNDETGDKLRKILERTPVNIEHFLTIDEKAPITYVLSDPGFHDGAGERTFINGIRAAWRMIPEALDEEFFDADIVLFGGTALIPRVHEALTSLTYRAREKGCITIVTTVYDFINEKRNPDSAWPLGETDETYENIDLLITDYEEALRLSGCDSLDAAAKSLIEKGTSALVVTNGAKEVFAYSNGEFFSPIKAVLPLSHAVEDARVEGPVHGDTTGAGDNFAGGVIASLITQMQYAGRGAFDLREACIWGIASGDFACFYIGGTYIEKYPGEKKKHIQSIYNQYIQENKK
ncbi:MAG: carbohydrate kinase family protein [Spirochaetales bacterium]|jgi:sugar/nucleoside kinase (ribokinase family)|nr:carbohydrate kinase family protein [Spirochaetales bacterium]